ncbi:CsbD family protein [Marinobacter sp. NFXS9]
MNFFRSWRVKGKWKQQVGAAKLAWGELTEDELLKVEGRQEKLTGLIQERYGLERDEAARQVNEFLEKHKV